MSVIGIDFGNESCYVAVARAGGIETVDNDYSLRATPSYVAFGDKQRILGVPAKNQSITNLKNTIHGFKRLLGRKFNDEIVQNEIKTSPFKIVATPNGGTGIEVNYLNSYQTFSIEQITAMLFTKIKETAEKGIMAKVHDCVLSVPSYFVDIQRRALLDAAQLAGLNVLRLMNETTATALNYGIYKQDLPPPEEAPRVVVFVDCGHSALQVFVCSFNRGKLKMLATASDSQIGGRNFDELIASYFVDEFRTKYRVDARTNHRAYSRLLGEVEKLKKQMSANSTNLPINIECFMDEKDVTGTMNRATFESMCSDLFHRVEITLNKCFQESKLKLEDINSVEIVGGTSRIPYIKQLIEKVFGKSPSTTLNQDEAVARGCALQCAVLSPSYKVREFSVTDVQPYTIKLVWDENKGEDGVMEVFPKFYPVPQLRMLSFYRKEPITLKALYESEIPFPIPEIGTFIINNIKATPEGENSKIKIKARVNLHGIFNIEGATLYEKTDAVEEEAMDTDCQVINPQNSEVENHQEVDDSVGEKNNSTDEEAKNNTDAMNNAEEDTGEKEKKVAKKKQHYKTIDLPVEAFTFGIPKNELDNLIEAEGRMIAEDRQEKERIDAKNGLEEYIYDLREKLDGSLIDFIQKEDKNRLFDLLTQVEDWLYDEGSDKMKNVYSQKIEDIKKQGEPIKDRKREYEETRIAIKELEIALQIANKHLDLVVSKDAKFDHLEKEDIDKFVQAVKDSENYLDMARQAYVSATKYFPLPVKSSDIFMKRKTMESTINPIVNKPKPTVEPPKDTTVPTTTTTKDEEAKPAAGQNSTNTPTNNHVDSNMEVD